MPKSCQTQQCPCFHKKWSLSFQLAGWSVLKPRWYGQNLFIQCLAPVSQPRQWAVPPTEGVCYCMQIDSVLFRLNCSPPSSPLFHSSTRNMNAILLKGFPRRSLFSPSRTQGSQLLLQSSLAGLVSSPTISDKATFAVFLFGSTGTPERQTMSDKAICCLTFGLTQWMDGWGGVFVVEVNTR